MVIGWLHACPCCMYTQKTKHLENSSFYIWLPAVCTSMVAPSCHCSHMLGAQASHAACGTEGTSMNWIHRDGRLRKQVQEAGSEVCDYAGPEEGRLESLVPFQSAVPSLPTMSLGVGFSLGDYFPRVGSGNREVVSAWPSPAGNSLSLMACSHLSEEGSTSAKVLLLLLAAGPLLHNGDPVCLIHTFYKPSLWLSITAEPQCLLMEWAPTPIKTYPRHRLLA